MEHKTKLVPKHNMSYLQTFFQQNVKVPHHSAFSKIETPQNIQIRWSKKMKREYFMILSHQKPFQTFRNLFKYVGFLLQWQHNAKVPHHSAFSKVEKTQNTQIELGPKENIL